MSFLEDVFEAEDGFSPDTPPTGFSHEFFSRHTSDPSHPLLHPTQLQKTTKLFSNLVRSRNGTSKVTGSTPTAKRRVTGVDPMALSRILKLLERSVRMGQDIDPFGISTCFKGKELLTTVDGKGSTSKKPKTEHSRSPCSPHEAENPLPGTNYEELRDQLEIAKDSILAADSCLAILTSDRLPKEVCTI